MINLRQIACLRLYENTSIVISMVNCSIVGWFESLTKKDELNKRQFPRVYFASLALVLSVIIFLGDGPLFISMVGMYVLSIWNYLELRVNKSK